MPWPDAGLCETHFAFTLCNNSTSVTLCPALSDTIAPTTSPNLESGSPRATASDTAGWAYRAFSTSEDVICGERSADRLVPECQEERPSCPGQLILLHCTHVFSTSDDDVFHYRGQLRVCMNGQLTSISDIHKPLGVNLGHISRIEPPILIESFPSRLYISQLLPQQGLFQN